MSAKTQDLGTPIIAKKEISWRKRASYFYSSISDSINCYIRPDENVLLINADTGGVLRHLKADKICAYENDPAKIAACRDLKLEQSKSEIKFVQDLTKLGQESTKNESETNQSEKFDHIIFGQVEDDTDLIKTLNSLKPFLTRSTRLHVIHFNFLYVPIYRLLEKIGFKRKRAVHNWLSSGDIKNFASLAQFEHVKERYGAILPFEIPILSFFFNTFLFKLPLLKLFNLARVNTFRPLHVSGNQSDHQDFTVSICIPCKNEVGNIEAAVQRIPQLGKSTEIIFGDDKSTDGTKEKIQEMIQAYPEKNIRLVDSPGISKSKNVWTCFAESKGDILMILDADLTVAPEELPYFYNAISGQTTDFVNGSRLVYPMDKEAMRFANIIGNKFFSLLFSAILGQTIKDTLCGTKVFFRKDFEKKILPMSGKWGIEDRWGDYDLIFGAAWAGMKITDLPVHYLERTAGKTKMTGRLKNGLIMLSLSWRAMIRFIFQK